MLWTFVSRRDAAESAVSRAAVEIFDGDSEAPELKVISGKGLVATFNCPHTKVRKMM